ncbi:MAG: zinc-ribbon domain-containing protein, partial [Myxococcales bacterium]|nr:zinc-ribbon domain-containing protein [Myxococcales bacterium]
MKVNCEKCSTEFEFDDAKIPEAGITVKCTHCGHLFRVEGPDDEVFADAPLGSLDEVVPRTGWRIRRRNGDELEFDDLATLRQWIVERRVAREDEISKTGESWKPLGSIIELANLFVIVD